MGNKESTLPGLITELFSQIKDEIFKYGMIAIMSKVIVMWWPWT